MTDIEITHIKEKLKRKNLEIREFEGQLRKQYDEIQELLKKLEKRLQFRNRPTSGYSDNINKQH